MTGIELYAPRKPRHRRTWTVAALVLAVVFIVTGQIAGAVPGVLLGFLSPQGEAIGWQGTAFTLASFAFTAGIVILWVTLFERRGLATIGFNGSGPKRFLRGYAVGLAFLVAVVGIIWALGGYRVDAGGAFAAANVGAALFPIVVLMLGFVIQGSTEEILTRGWLMQVIASRHGLAWGLGLSSVLFGLLHALNIEPSPELLTGVLNVILFGVFIGMYAAREGSLWGVCGWHAAWNWLLGLGFGLEVSGQVIETTPLIVDLGTRTTVPWWITGAAFGPEGSVVTTAVLLIGSAILIFRGRSKDHGVVDVAGDPAA
ncbi:type II CAAX endopeptidase family protein [Brevundimonas sp.]|uniref:CPBP family intramembrane glutamic endopeptidase n=1 Tax=Brevundimonas sp. TaxID=1871086 RepID=UPI002D4179D3|nr:type II CAAX endopeptidase family protein [Brevundimonas sp.]HYD27028.1 type II CAAX endopeptidase family protein [Brevundimonas sp.]